MTTGFFSWRWAPAILLVLGATAVALAAVVFIPSSIGAPELRARAPAAQEAASRVNEDEGEAAVATVAPARRAKRGNDPTSTSGVESFFPAVPEAALPPPLPDDPVPPEPAETATNRGTFGPGVEPASVPPP